MIGFLTFYFAMIFVFGFGLGGLVLCLMEVYDMDSCLSDKEQFFRCLFQWEVFVWEHSEDYVNFCGRVLLTSLTFILCFPCNLLALIALVVCEIGRFVVIGFLKIFGKKN